MSIRARGAVGSAKPRRCDVHAMAREMLIGDPSHVVVTRSSDRVSATLAENLSLGERLRLNAERKVAASRAYLLNGEDTSLKRFHELDTTFAATLEQVSRLLAGHVPLAIEYDANAYVGAVKDAADQRGIANDPSAIIAFFDRELQPKREAFERDVNRLVAGE